MLFKWCGNVKINITVHDFLLRKKKLELFQYIICFDQMVYTLNFQNIKSKGGDELVEKVKISLDVIEKAFSKYR